MEAAKVAEAKEAVWERRRAATTAGTEVVPPQEGKAARNAAMAVAVEMAVAREVAAREAEARAPVALAMSYPRR